MVDEKHVEGYDGYKSAMESLKGSKTPVYLLFCGSKTPDGQSWCPDCVQAEPVIEECVKSEAGEFTLVHVGVGNRATWKDLSNPFRTDPALKLKCVPTLMRSGKPQRLEESQCWDSKLVDMMFED